MAPAHGRRLGGCAHADGFGESEMLTLEESDG
jgi:hypothetical protein